MIRAFVISTVSALSVSAAVAADASIVISAGEHGDFSRIVVAGGGLGVVTEKSGNVIRLSNIGAAGIDLGDINVRQKAFRINRARQTESGVVEFEMNCDCSVRTSRLANGKLIIDIAGASTPPSSGQKSAASKPANPPKTPAPAAKTEDTLSVDQARDRMVALLEQAAQEGLITLRDETKPAPKEQPSPTAAQPVAQAQTPTTAPKNDQSAQQPGAPVNLVPEAQTVAATTNATAQTKPAAAAAKQRCLSDAVFAIDGAPFEKDPLVAIDGLQTQLAEASQGEKRALMLQLVNGFLSIGFGDEALALLNGKGDGASILADMARAVAERPVAGDGVLMGAKNCAGAHALWQAVASDGEDAIASYARSEGAIAQLPNRLRTLIATRLAVKMVDLSNWAAAQQLFDVAVGEDEVLSPDLKYVQTRLADHDAEADKTRDTLLEIATQNSSASDDALLALAESYASHGAEPHEGFTEDIGALAKIAGSSRAAFSEAFSWAAMGNLDAAMTLLKNEARKDATTSDAAGVSAAAMIERALASDDPLLKVSALDAYLAHQPWIDPQRSKLELRDGVAAYSYDAGLPNLAFALLRTRPAPTKETNRRIAEAAIAADRPGDALRAAAPFATDPLFGALVANANIAKKDYHAALASAATINDETIRPRMKARAGWLSRTWSAAAEGFRGIDPNELDRASATRFAFSAYMNGDKTAPSAVEAVLSQDAPILSAGLRALFAESAARSTLQRAKLLAESTADEIAAFEEIMSDG